MARQGGRGGCPVKDFPISVRCCVLLPSTILNLKWTISNGVARVLEFFAENMCSSFHLFFNVLIMFVKTHLLVLPLCFCRQIQRHFATTRRVVKCVALFCCVAATSSVICPVFWGICPTFFNLTVRQIRHIERGFEDSYRHLAISLNKLA